MDSTKPDVIAGASTSAAASASKPPTLTSSRIATIRSDKSTILEMPKLVPVTDAKSPTESSPPPPPPQQPPSQQLTQQSVLKKSVTTVTGAGGQQQNLIKVIPRPIPIKTVQGPNGNLIVQGHNKFLCLNLAKEKTAMLKLSNVATIQTRKILPKGPLPSQAPTPTKQIITTAKLPNTTIITKQISKEVTMTTTTTGAKPTIKEFIKEILEPTQKDASKLNPIMTTLSSATSSVINTLVSSKTLEIKPITVTNSPKAPTPAQAATVPITQITATNLLTKLGTHKSPTDTHPTESDSHIIERKVLHKLQPIKSISVAKKEFYPSSTVNLTPVAISASNKMINLQISNGKLSDPNGPIKLISANQSVTKEQHEKLQEISKQTFPLAIKVPEPSTSEDFSSLSPQKTSRQDSNESEHSAGHSKFKRESLLRNKIIEILQRSPRTKGRSKSLTALNQKLKTQKRRSSAASDGDIQRDEVADKSSPKFTSPSAVTVVTPPDVQVKKLLCPEKISTSSDSLGSTSPVEEKVNSIPISYSSSEVIEMNSSDDEMKPIVEDIAAISKINENEVYSCLNWSEGIGSLKDSLLQFQFNEFGLIEIVDSKRSVKREIDTTYDKPIFEREFKSQKTLDYSNPYYCKGCHCKGAAVDFLTPEFCSRECIRRYNGRLSSGIGTKPKKYTNRKRPTSPPMDDRKDEVFEIKTESSSQYPGKPFTWEAHLTTCKGEPTPIDLFLNPFPCSSNMFQIGMKLEAIDPEHSTLFCVCTIVEKKGYRLKLHFDGYSKFYDFWVNADSMDIFPPGWCAKTNRVLQPPRGISPLSFNWPMYLNRTKALPAPRNLFTHLNASSQNHGFKIGMKIEADDLRNSGKVCAATIADILDNRLLIHFDGWDDSYSYWIEISSPYIHPVNWHKKNGFSIVPPPEYQDRFTWGNYLMETKGHPATDELFRTRDPIEFKPGMKLEVVDKRNSALIRPATVIMTDDFEIKVLFEEWPMEYAFWVEDDSPDIHPIGWCEITNHDLESPPGYERLPSRYDCDFPGCRGIGNALHPELEVHANIKSCPYEPSNWTKEIDKTGRLNHYDRHAISVVEAKPRGAIPRGKRKSEHFPRPPVFAKLPKQTHPVFIQQSKPVSQPQKSTGISLLASKQDKPEPVLDTRISIARHLLCDYGPRLQQVYSLWKRNSECLTANLPENQDLGKNPFEWTATEVADYVGKLPRCQAIAPEFIRNDIDGTAFLSMRQSDLTDIMTIKLGPAIKIYNQIVHLREDVVTRFMSNFSKVS